MPSSKAYNLETPSITSGLVGKPSSTVWIETMKKSSPSLQSQQVWGRIVATGSNYVVTGYNQHGEWTRIPCHNVSTARLYLGRVMTQFDFEIHSLNVKRGC